MPTELIRVNWDHILYDYGKGRLMLTVLCGRSAVFSVDLFLTATECEKYSVEGAQYIALLASEVRCRPGCFQERHALATQKKNAITD